jgi:hypothetical protein
MPSAHEALTAFTEQNPDLMRLESLLMRFNLFEAVGVVRHELRHSDFLAYLLDPSHNHGLGDVFLREFLQAIHLPQFDLDALGLSQAYVFREWHHVDILVVDDVNRFAVIVENKIDTAEHSDQLNRYRQELDSHYPGYTAVGLYLTPEGDAPSSADYHPVSYTLVCEVIEKIARNHRVTLDSEIVIVLEHYAQMLRRHIVSDSEVAELCRSIYQKHRQALDLIFEHRPDKQAQVGEFVRSLIEQEPSTKLYNFAKGWINFSLQDWDTSLKYRHPDTNYALFPYLTFGNMPNRLIVGMWIGRGDQRERELVRRKAQETGVTGVAKSLSQRPYTKISSLEILSPRDYQKSWEEIEALILDKWRDFLDNELPKMMQAVREEKWLWTLPEEYDGTPIMVQ